MFPDIILTISVEHIAPLTGVPFAERTGEEMLPVDQRGDEDRS